ncbi:signal recognition particle-docking protein FtsY [Halobellus limi]|uniref:Signal recognition particle receptor FtsY n=1 Tax=Halobellus limi TaxID=699433 RepID=A0A1H5WMV3_9EURY|nr:signal recognition particle-docking protein FtsY [Halobellus limi]QCC46397.1 signal recognition particle-docking protein FtsY [Halobellus limi]SEG00556.1 fused signal recognition particle receptor [Halobellus limi]
MFDGLKKKLDSFREDVEETAEENAEEAAPDDSESVASDEESVASDESAASDAPADESGDVSAEEPGNASQDASAAGSPTGSTGRSASVDAEADGPADGDGDASEVESGATDGETASDDRAAVSDSDRAADSDDADTGPLASEEAAAALREDATDDSGPGRLKRAAAFATGKIIIEEEDLEDPLWELEMALLESDVEMNVAEEILDTIREKMIGETRAQVETTGELVQTALHDALYEVISVGQFDFDERVEESEKPVTIVFTGVNGVGKTTSIAKMARYFERKELSVVMANGDTYRAGANEQIQKHADNLDTKLITHEQGGDPAAVLYDAVEYAEAHDVDVVLGDTAGRLHTSNDLMAQLEKIDRVVDPDMTLFVDEAVAGQDAVERAKTFNDAAEIDGAVLTKADADSNGGAAISIAYVTGKPILFLGTGQGYDDIERFDPERMVERLVGEES